jgi:hypothetical protein
MSKRAGNRNRTGDLLITSQLLYQLSYAGFTKSEPDITWEEFVPQTEILSVRRSQP